MEGSLPGPRSPKRPYPRRSQSAVVPRGRTRPSESSTEPGPSLSMVRGPVAAVSLFGFDMDSSVGVGCSRTSTATAATFLSRRSPVFCTTRISICFRLARRDSATCLFALVALETSRSAPGCSSRERSVDLERER